MHALCSTGANCCTAGCTDAVAKAAAGSNGAAPVGAQSTGTATSTASVKETICLPVPGAISKIAVKTGDAVKEGDLLFTFEALKMENDMTAPCSGTVGRIYKTAGDSSDTGEPVLELV